MRGDDQMAGHERDEMIPSAGVQIEVPERQKIRQAVTALRGYAHQLYLSALEWEGLARGSTLLLEVAEDYATVVNNALLMTQSKDDAASGSLTLRTPGARNAIVSLWEFQRANPGVDVRLAYLTTATMGREREFLARAGPCGIDRWRAGAAGQPQPELRGLLCDLGLPPDLVAFVRTADDADLQEQLFTRLSWNCDAPSTETVRKALVARSIDRASRVGLLASEGEDAVPAIVDAVLQAIVTGNRLLTCQDFDRTFEEATSISVSKGQARRLIRDRDAGDKPIWTAPSVPRNHVDRPSLTRSVALALSRDERVALIGAGGTGKTTLAIRVLDDAGVRDKYPDGVLWASIGPDSELPSIHLEAWIRMLGAVPPRTDDEEVLAATWRGLLRDRRMIVVVDDVWRLDHVSVLVPPSGCGFLTTSRNSRLATVVQAVPIGVGRLEEVEALELLEAVAGNPKPTEGLGELIERVGGIALPIVLMGALLRDGTNSADLAAALDDEFLRLSALDLDSGGVEGEEGSRRTFSLEASLGLGVRALDEPHRAAFYRLAVLPHGATFDAMAARTILGDYGPSVTGRILSGLVARGLLDLADAEGTASRDYRMHGLLLDYAMTGFGTGRSRVASVPSHLPDTMTKLHQELLDRLIRSAGPARWAEVDASPYFDLHLFSHIMAADRPDLLYELLMTPDVEGRAAWYGRIRRKGGTASFLRDLVRVIDFAGSKLSEAKGDHEPGAALTSACTTFAFMVHRARTIPVGLLPALVGAKLISPDEAITRAALSPSINSCWLLAELLPFAPSSYRPAVWSSFLAQALEGSHFAAIGDDELLAAVLPVMSSEELDDLLTNLPMIPPLVHGRVAAGLHRVHADRAATAVASFMQRQADAPEAASWNAGLIHLAASGVQTSYDVEYMIGLLKSCGPFGRDAQQILVLLDDVELTRLVRTGDARALANVLEPFERLGVSFPLPALLAALSVLEDEADVPFRAVVMARLCSLAGESRSDQMVHRTLDLLLGLPDHDWRKADGLGGLVPLSPADRRKEVEEAFVRSASAAGFGHLGFMRLRRIAAGLSGSTIELVLDALEHGTPLDRQVTLGALLEHAPERLLPTIAAAVVVEAGKSGRIGDIHHAAHRIPEGLLPLIEEGVRLFPMPEFVEAVRLLVPDPLPLPKELLGWIDDVWDLLEADTRLRIASCHSRYLSAADVVADVTQCALGRSGAGMDALHALCAAAPVLSRFDVSEVQVLIGRCIVSELAKIDDHAIPAVAALALYFDEDGRGLLLQRISAVAHARWAADALVSLAPAWPSRQHEIMSRAVALIAEESDARSAAEWLLMAGDLLDAVIVAPLLHRLKYADHGVERLLISIALYRFLSVEERSALPTQLRKIGPLPGAILNLVDAKDFSIEMWMALDACRPAVELMNPERAGRALLDAEALLEEHPLNVAGAFDRMTSGERVSTCVGLLKTALRKDMRLFSRVVARIAPVLRSALGDDVGRCFAEAMARAGVLHARRGLVADQQ